MSDYLVEYPPKSWTDFPGLAKSCGVRFARKDIRLGESLIRRNDLPEPRPHYVDVHDFCGVSSVGRLLERPMFDWMVPVHPMGLFLLVA